jgi:osmotically inducible protein OsmC
MSTLYSTKVTASGGRHGSIRSEDGVLALDLAIPASMGGKGGATNPEQLFAGGYAACFENAMFHVAKAQGVKFRESDITVTADVGLTPNGSGGFALTAALDVVVAGLDLEIAEAVVRAAHVVCPYSNALRNNVDVKLTVSVN